MKQHMLTHKIRDIPQHMFGNTSQLASPDSSNSTIMNFHHREQLGSFHENSEDEKIKMSQEIDEFSESSNREHRFSPESTSRTSVLSHASSDISTKLRKRRPEESERSPLRKRAREFSPRIRSEGVC